VLQNKCRTCHGNPVNFGAPMPLVTYADTQGAAVTNPSAKVWQQMNTRVTRGDMPPANFPALTTDERAALMRWFDSGAPSGAACTGGGTGGAGGSGGSAGTGGSGGSGGLDLDYLNSVSGEQYLPCQGNIKGEMRAHTQGSTAKFSVPLGTVDNYVCFTFKSPFASNEIATAFANNIDNSHVIHHWILYGMGSGTDGGIVSGVGCQVVSISGSFITGWAPGGSNGVYPPDLAMKLGYPYYTLQVHYNNPNNGGVAGATDASGPSFCTETDTGKRQLAGVVTLGTASISIPAGGQNIGTGTSCNLQQLSNNQPVYVISTSPHMHTHGTGFRTTWSGQSDLINIPIGSWVFNDQYKYPVNRRPWNPGDTLTTTCYYSNPGPGTLVFGPSTTQEMCYNFVAVYPIGNVTAANHKCGPTI